VVTLAVVALVLTAGVAFLFFAQPSVAGVDNRFGAVNETATVIESDLQVRNPNPVGATLGGLTVDYAIDMNGIRMATGTKGGLSVPQGESTVPMTTRLANERIPMWWVSHLRNDQVTDLRIDFSARFELPTGTVEIPLDPRTYTRTVETDVFGNKVDESGDPDGTATPTPSDDGLLSVGMRGTTAVDTAVR
jgi:LEA14-like dessication related protein